MPFNCPAWQWRWWRAIARSAIVGDGRGGVVIRVNRWRLGRVRARTTPRSTRPLQPPDETVSDSRRTAEDLPPNAAESARLQSFLPYLRKRVLEDGCGNAALLYQELREQGYRGSVRTVRRYVAPLRAGLVTLDLPPKPPSVRDVRRWITSDPDQLTDDDKAQLAAILDRSQPLAPWPAAVDTETADLPHLRSFAQGPRRDHAAVLNGLSLPCSSGAVEGETAKSSTSN